ncbi:unnamed protein product [Fusarium graminearum]|nr:unnamed protein product [Fusarium graminearum]
MGPDKPVRIENSGLKSRHPKRQGLLGGPSVTLATTQHTTTQVRETSDPELLEYDISDIQVRLLGVLAYPDRYTKEDDLAQQSLLLWVSTTPCMDGRKEISLRNS